MAGIDVNRGAKRARDARTALGLGAAAPVECILTVVEDRHPIAVAALPDGVAGACFRTADGAVLWVNGEQAVQRQRFTLAHEFGHAWCEHDGTLEPDSFETLSGRTSNPYEIQANAFAAEFLVPRAGMQERVTSPPTLDEIVTLATEYGVSAIVVVYRLKQLKLAPLERIARLQREVEDGHHAERFEVLGLEPPADRLAAIDRLPYLSPSLDGTLLAAARRGEAAVDGETANAIERLLS